MRNSTSEAVILSVKQSGENNRTVLLLTPEEGLVYATLYGGPKSRLKSLVSPFNAGTVWLYSDPSKNSVKITDFDPKKYHLSFTENLFKTYAASFGAEIILKTKCGGSPQQAFYLYNGLLDGMEASTENESRAGLIRFLWRYAGVLGVRPDTQTCCHCDKSFVSGKIAADTLNYKTAYSEGDNGFVCSDCTSIEDKRFVLSRNSLIYLEAVKDLAPKDVRSIAIDGQTMQELKDFCYSFIENCCGTKLLSLQTGSGIL